MLRQNRPMHDTHFLERLPRASQVESELALGLYRNPELVRVILKGAAPTESERVAIALSPVEDPSHLVVARDGAFVTCLARGMSTGPWPRIGYATVTSIATRHEELRARIALWVASAERAGEMRRLLREVFESGSSLSRETVSALMPLVPAIWPLLLERAFECGNRSRDIVHDQASRLLRRRDRLSSREIELLETVWNCEWAKAHIAVLLGAIHRDIIEVMSADPQLIKGLALFRSLFFQTALLGFQPHVARGLWFVSRFGKHLVRTFKDDLAQPRNRMRVDIVGVPMALASIAFSRDKVRAEITKALRTSEKTSLSAVTRGVLVQLLEVDPVERQATTNAFRETHAKIVGDASVPPIDWASATPEELARLRDCSPSIYVDSRYNLWTDITMLVALMHQLSWIVALEPTQLYLPAREFSGAWHPRLTLSFLEELSPELIAVRKPVRAAAGPGRNDTCTCGSGKKYKRCCGA